MLRSLGERHDRNWHEAYRHNVAACDTKSATRSMGLLEKVLHPTFSLGLSAWPEYLLIGGKTWRDTSVQLARDCVSLC